MSTVAFADGKRIGVFRDGKVNYYESENILKAESYLSLRQESDEWKYTGEGARFRGDFDFFRANRQKSYAAINGLCFSKGSLLYSYTVNGNSGVYFKDISSDKAPERHVFTSSDKEILSIFAGEKKAYITLQGEDVSSSIGVLDLESFDISTLTAGDSLDKNPNLFRGEVYFDTAGVGRDANGEYTGKYSPAEICKLNLSTMQIEEVKGDRKFGFIKPKFSPEGTLYYIKRPLKEKRKNPLVEMFLIPVRIFQAIAMFIQAFVISWTGKSLTEGGENPARGREKKGGQIFVEGNLIEADKELKRSRKAKDGLGGFIPKSWTLMRVFEGKEQKIYEGTVDYCFGEEGEIFLTNGKRILSVKDGKVKKIADAEKCLTICSDFNLDGEHSTGKDELFIL